MSSVRSGLLVASLVFVSAMVLFTEHASAPFYYHQDEPGKVLQVIHRRKNFHHPLLMLTTAEVARKAFLHGGAEDDPQRVVEMARTIMAAFAAASAALLALLATRLQGLWAGLAVGLVLRAGGGEASLGIPAFLPYPDWDGQFPFRTLAMLASLGVSVVVSRATAKIDPPRPLGEML